jgi:uncharacterized protein (DUF488 family)
MPPVEPTSAPPPVVFTIGHSTRSGQAFLALLQAQGVERVADVRTVPRSRRNPQFDGQALAAALTEKGIEYRHLPALGGLRHPRRDSPNTGWRNESFRGFADHMQEAEFAQGLEELIELARGRRTAVMCAEARPWRCHRSLIADALSVRGVRVLHIMAEGKVEEHALTPFARVEGIRVTYPPEAEGPGS